LCCKPVGKGSFRGLETEVPSRVQVRSPDRDLGDFVSQKLKNFYYVIYEYNVNID